MEENCHVDPVLRIPTMEERQKTQITLLAVTGMGCPNCAARVRNSLVLLNGVVDAYVDHIAGIARVAFNPDLVKIDILIDATASAGNDGRHEYAAQLLRAQ
jgi:copper chaperone CopZ